jgi:hypothetical protein
LFARSEERLSTRIDAAERYGRLQGIEQVLQFGGVRPNLSLMYGADTAAQGC